jgi:hypothetical protein
VGVVIGVSGGHAGKEVLVALAGQQVAVAQRLLAELGQELVARRVGLDVELGRVDALGGARNGGADIVARYL